MSYLEIYNENIRDLLNPSSGFLELREDSRGRNIQVTRLSEVSTASAEEVSTLKLTTYIRPFRGTCLDSCFANSYALNIMHTERKML